MSQSQDEAGNREEKTKSKKFKLQHNPSTLPNVRSMTWNVTSMINKTSEIMELVTDRDPSIVFLQETWLKTNKSNVTALVKDYGYVLVHNIRKNRKKIIGGGVGIMLKNDVKYKRIKHKEYDSFEHVIVKINVGNSKSLLAVSIYRVLFVSVTTFLEEIVQFFENLVSLKDDIILAGDVNIHMDTNESNTIKFKEILNDFNIEQHVHFPSHIQGHTLDIIATFGEGPHISGVEASPYDVSHHHLIDFKVSVSPEHKAVKEVWCRNLKNVDMVKFMEEVQERIQITDSGFGENIGLYNTVLADMVDRLAPLQKKSIKVVSAAPWFDTEYKEIRKQRRRAEKKLKKTKSAEDREHFNRLRKQTSQLAHQKKCKHYEEKLKDNRVLFSGINKLLDNEQEEILPEAESDVELANRFLRYFTEKIEKIRATFPSNTPDVDARMPPPRRKLVSFELATEDEIREIVAEYGTKCSPEDPVPASLLKKVDLDIFIPIWTKLVNISLEEGSMELLKSGVLVPLIKQLDDLAGKDKEKNYRPVTNLQFVGKLIERVVKKRLNEHMVDQELESDFEHGYKEGHSTETLLLEAIDELLMSCDKGLPSVIMLLDLSAAFDTIDQEKLLSILREEIGIDGTALKWFESFIKDRTQRVKIRDSYSETGRLIYGEPQGSVLGPPLFNIYIRSLKRHVDPSKFSIYGFADDHQLIKTFLPVLQVQALDGDINKCFELITEWMNSYFLKLNASKTKILIIAPPSLRHTIKIQGTFIEEACIRFDRNAKNLGVIIDDELSFKEHIGKVVTSCFVVIRKLSKIKEFLTFEQLRTAVSAFIFSVLDYCNSLFFGLEANLIDKLQSVQNAAARLVKGRNGFKGSTSEFIRKCHWLRVKERIVFKICLVVHKCLHGKAPKCLTELLKYSGSSRTMKLEQPAYKGSFGSRCFRRVGPKVWNLLPMKIRVEKDTEEFKKQLKTFLFDGFHHFEQKLNER